MHVYCPTLHEDDNLNLGYGWVLISNSHPPADSEAKLWLGLHPEYKGGVLSGEINAATGALPCYVLPRRVLTEAERRMIDGRLS